MTLAFGRLAVRATPLLAPARMEDDGAGSPRNWRRGWELGRAANEIGQIRDAKVLYRLQEVHSSYPVW